MKIWVILDNKNLKSRIVSYDTTLNYIIDDVILDEGYIFKTVLYGREFIFNVECENKKLILSKENHQTLCRCFN